MVREMFDFEVGDNIGNIAPQTGIYPDMLAPIIRNRPGLHRELVKVRWGCLPHPTFSTEPPSAGGQDSQETWPRPYRRSGSNRTRACTTCETPRARIGDHRWRPSSASWCRSPALPSSAVRSKEDPPSRSTSRPSSDSASFGRPLFARWSPGRSDVPSPLSRTSGSEGVAILSRLQFESVCCNYFICICIPSPR